MRNPGFHLAVASVSMLATTLAWADAAGDAVLTRVDAALNRGKTHKIEWEVTHRDAGKEEKKLAITELRKGEKRLLEFTAPADMKGTKLLILSKAEVYVYLPAFGKVRRVASHTTSQGFMGLALSVDDLTNAGYAAEYSATIGKETATLWSLTLAPKTAGVTSYSKLELEVNKSTALPVELRTFGADGKLLKTESRSSFSCEGDVCLAGSLKLTLPAAARWTTLSRKSWKVNETVSDDLFSKRNLEK